MAKTKDVLTDYSKTQSVCITRHIVYLNKYQLAL